MLDVSLAVPMFVLAVAITGYVRRTALRARLLAIPDARSSHSIPTPVGGGLAIVLTFTVAMTTLGIMEWLSPFEVAALGAGMAVAVIGLVDDRQPVDFRLRLAVQAGGSLWALAWIGAVPPLQVANLALDPGVITWLVVPLALIWLTNLYNFMDGIDGIAGTEACCVTLIAGLMLVTAGDWGLGALCLALFAGCAGFLVWNWPPARIFMGDVGSGFLGYVLGLLALLSHVHGSMNPWSWLLLLGVFVVDATVTLARRILAGQPWYQAHRSHAYQHASRRFGGHRPVTVTVLAINLGWLAPLAWLAGKHPEYGVYLALAGIVPLIGLALWLGAGLNSTERKGSTR